MNSQETSGRRRDKEKQSTYWKNWYATNREKVSIQKKAYRSAHLEELLARNRAYKASHRQEIKTQQKVYQAIYRERAAAPGEKTMNQILNPSQESKRENKDGGLRKDIEELRQGVERGDGKATLDRLNRKFARLRNLRIKG